MRQIHLYIAVRIIWLQIRVKCNSISEYKDFLILLTKYALSFACPIIQQDANKGEILFCRMVWIAWLPNAAKFKKPKFGCFHLEGFSLSVPRFYNLGPMSSKLHGTPTYMTTGTEQAEKTLTSVELQSGSQQQLTSHCAGVRSQTHRAATTEIRGGPLNFATSGEWLPPATAKCWKSISYKRSILFFYCTLGAICEVKISQFECFSIWGFPQVSQMIS